MVDQIASSYYLMGLVQVIVGLQITIDLLSIQFESLTVNIVRSENLKLKPNFHYITVINITIPIAISFIRTP